MKKEQLILESNILIALFKATVEQSAFLTSEFKQKPKQVFNLWQKQGDLLLNEIEKMNLENVEYIDAMADVIHNIIEGIRKQHFETVKTVENEKRHTSKSATRLLGKRR